jgi:hypothetical protein
VLAPVAGLFAELPEPVRFLLAHGRSRDRRAA